MPGCSRRPCAGGSSRRFPGALVCYLLVAVVAFLTYAHVLDYFFVGRDSLTLIDIARVRSGADVARFLTTRVVYNPDTGWPVDYYRPLSNLSYSLDYFLWGLNPFGYHLTDIIINVLVSLLVFSVASSITRGDRLIALVGALLFTLHPILVEIVPVSSRRHDTLAALFFLLSFLLYIRGKRRGCRALSILCYVLSLCSKEVAITLPFVIWAYRAICAEGRGRIMKGLRASAPFLCVTAAYIMWRLAVPGVTAYKRGAATLATMARMWLSTVSGYFTDLVYPVDFLALLPRSAAAALYVFAACVVAILLILSWRRFGADLRKRSVAGRVAGFFLFSLAALSAVALFSCSTISREIAGWGGQAGRYSVDTLTALFIGTFSVSFAATWLGFLFVANPGRLREALEASPLARLAAFLSLWLLLPFLLYLATARFAHRYMYLPAVPFSMLLAVGLCASLRSLRRGIAPLRNAACFSLCTLLAASLLAYSPILRSYRGWEGSGTVSSMFLNKLLDVLPGLPRDAVLHVYGLPSGVSSYDRMVPRVKSVGYIPACAVRSWLNLNDPDNERRVFIHDRGVLEAVPRALRLEVETDPASNDVVVSVLFEPWARGGDSSP